jgi:hypothetical protein
MSLSLRVSVLQSCNVCQKAALVGRGVSCSHGTCTVKKLGQLAESSAVLLDISSTVGRQRQAAAAAMGNNGWQQHLTTTHVHCPCCKFTCAPRGRRLAAVGDERPHRPGR